MGKLSMDLSSRRQKGEILEELCAVSGYHKKHAIRLLNQRKKRVSKQKEKRGRPEEYPDSVFLEPLKNIWLNGAVRNNHQKR